MFTGIIRQIGKVVRTSPTAAGRRLEIDLGALCDGLCPGDSVAVNGACLTAVTAAAPLAAFDVIAETLSRTTLGDLRPGSRVNLERPLRLGEGLDGHLVQGHVDGIAEVRTVHRGPQWVVEFAAGRELTDQMVAKGSVAVDGVSLTLVDVAAGRFRVAMIPTTLRETALADLRGGGRVNIETDLIGKYVRKALAAGAAPGGGMTLEKLKESGFA